MKVSSFPPTLILTRRIAATVCTPIVKFLLTFTANSALSLLLTTLIIMNVFHFCYECVPFLPSLILTHRIAAPRSHLPAGPLPAVDRPHRPAAEPGGGSPGRASHRPLVAGQVPRHLLPKHHSYVAHLQQRLFQVFLPGSDIPVFLVTLKGMDMILLGSFFWALMILFTLTQ